MQIMSLDCLLYTSTLMSEAIIAKKAELVDVVAEKMKAAASIVVVDSRGLTVEQDTVCLLYTSRCV